MLALRQSRRSKTFLRRAFALSSESLHPCPFHGSFVPSIDPPCHSTVPSSLPSKSLHLHAHSNIFPRAQLFISNKVFLNRIQLHHVRSMSESSSSAVGTEILANDLPPVINLDNLVQTQSEVARIASDSWPPIAGLQYLIEVVHVHYSIPWWASIAVTTFAIRFLLFPIIVYQMKAAARLAKIQPGLQKISEEFKLSDGETDAMEKYRKEAHQLFKEHKTTPFSPFIGPIIQAPLFICFFLAVQKMSHNIESFSTGGMLWFTDLSSPDHLYILPVLSSLSLLATIELGGEGLEGQPSAESMKKIFRVLAIASIPISATFPSALFCYWLPSNVMSILQVAIFRSKRVKKALGIPNVPPPPPSTSSSAASNPFDFSEMFSTEKKPSPSLPPRSEKTTLYSSKPNLKVLQKKDLKKS